MKQDITPVSAIVHSSEDNVAVLISAAKLSQTVNLSVGERSSLSATEDIPAFHKIALTEITTGETVIRHSIPIGEATQDIPKGGLVHVHNLRSLRA